LNIATPYAAPLWLGWTTLVQPINLALLTLGVVLGWLYVWLARDVARFAPLGLVAASAPLAQLLDPLSGMLLLIGLVCGSFMSGNDPASTTGRGMFVSVLLVVTAIVALTPIALVYRAFIPADRVALAGILLGLASLLAVGSMSQAVRHSLTRRLITALLPLLGAVLALAERHMASGPIDNVVVVWVAMVAVPLGLWLMAVHGRRQVPTSSVGAGLVAGQTPMLLWHITGLPITAAAALLAVILNTHGLLNGPLMLASRPKLAWAMIFAVLLGAGLRALIIFATRGRELAAAPWRNWSAALILLTISLAMFVFRPPSGGDLLWAVGVGGLALIIIAMGCDASWLVVGWVGGQFVYPHILAANKMGLILPGGLTLTALIVVVVLALSTVVWGRWYRR
jgi:hypothetical protein